MSGRVQACDFGLEPCSGFEMTPVCNSDVNIIDSERLNFCTGKRHAKEINGMSVIKNGMSTSHQLHIAMSMS